MAKSNHHHDRPKMHAVYVSLEAAVNDNGVITDLAVFVDARNGKPIASILSPRPQGGFSIAHLEEAASAFVLLLDGNV